MNFICIFFGLVFIFAGVMFSLGKVHIYLNEWKMLTQQEKENIRIQPLCMNIGTIIIFNGFIFLMKGWLTEFRNQWFVVFMMIWLLIAGVDVWYITKSNHYYKKYA